MSIQSTESPIQNNLELDNSQKVNFFEKMKKIFKKEYVFCYEENPTTWICECGHKDIDSVDKRSIELKNKTMNRTKYFPIHSWLPKFAKKRLVQIKLMPNIIMQNRENNEDKDK